MIKNVLRYPGGKSRAVGLILERIPSDIKEYREPMVGGGVVALAIKQKYPDVKVWINDLNYDLICFWKALRDCPEKLVEEVLHIKQTITDGRKLFEALIGQKEGSELERAVRFFVLNRITFSGTVDSGGYSQDAFKSRFTETAIIKLLEAHEIVKHFKITHGDYEPLLFEKGENVFIFLDPPYIKATKSRLYGKNGCLHTSFDHVRFAENVKKCSFKWLITYDDSQKIRKLFEFAYIYEWELQYGMNNYKQKQAKKGRELFICNYKLNKEAATISNHL